MQEDEEKKKQHNWWNANRYNFIVRQEKIYTLYNHAHVQHSFTHAWIYVEKLKFGKMQAKRNENGMRWGGYFCIQTKVYFLPYFYQLEVAAAEDEKKTFLSDNIEIHLRKILYRSAKKKTWFQKSCNQKQNAVANVSATNKNEWCVQYYNNIQMFTIFF